MGIKRGVWRHAGSGLAKDLGSEDLVMSDDRAIGGGVNPYESVGAVAARQLARGQRQDTDGPDTGGNPYEHGAKSPEHAWDAAGLDTRDCDQKASWLETRLARGNGAGSGAPSGRRRK